MNIGVESEWVEFKKTTGELKEGVISISSMLNKNGYGTLYFGVRDNGDVLGQQIGDRTLREVSQAIANAIKPQIVPTITLELLDEKNVIKVFAEGSDRPYSAFGRYYMRSADEDRELSPEQLRALLLKKAEHDPIVRMEATIPSLSFGQLRSLFIAKGLTVGESGFEENLGIKMENGSYNYMAELLADKNDLSIKVVRFRGKNKNEMIKRNEYGYKCLLVAMEQVLTYVEAINETDVKIGTHQREEEPLFDMRSFREAWINACLHTRWEKKNPPAVYVFSDRLEIVSTGGLPFDLTKEDFFRGISRPVNQKMQKIFGQLRYVEQTGHGIPLIIDRYGRQAFEFLPNFLIVTLPFSRGLNFESIGDYEEEMTPTQVKVLGLLRLNPKYTVNDMSLELGLSEAYLRRIVQFLKKSGRLTRVGSNKSGIWKIIE